MKIGDFEFLAALLKQHSGLMIGPEKTYLLESRLAPVARRRNLPGLEALVAALRLRNDKELLRDVVEAMTTNESFFFRDGKPFEQFRKVVLPHLLGSRNGTRRLRIWSAACSSGQEPYSLAMLLRESAALSGWHCEIVGTDLSNEMLEKARQGLYTQFEVQRGLPIKLLMQNFVQEGERWRIKPELRALVDFRYFNLLDDPSGLGRFDVIFLRNVLIYFDQPTKKKVLDLVSRQLAPDGYLFLGGAETVLGISERFQVVPGERGIYAPVPGVTMVAAAG